MPTILSCFDKQFKQQERSEEKILTSPEEGIMMMNVALFPVSISTGNKETRSHMLYYF